MECDLSLQTTGVGHTDWCIDKRRLRVSGVLGSFRVGPDVWCHLHRWGVGKRGEKFPFGKIKFRTYSCLTFAG